MGTITWCAQQDSNLRPLAPEANDFGQITPETTRGQGRGQDDIAQRIAELRARLIRQSRWYYAPVRLWRAFWAVPFFVVALSQAPASAAPMTPCDGSYDGPGMTLCEILGVPGIVGGIGYTPFASLPLPLPIFFTAHHNGRLTTTDVGLRYVDDDGSDFNTIDHPQQFAVWPLTPWRVVLGVEDLPDGDFDYNDHVVEWIIPGEPDPRGHEPEPIPEPAVLALFGSGALLSRAIQRRRPTPAARSTPRN
jgi:hypothetical protein